MDWQIAPSRVTVSGMRWLVMMAMLLGARSVAADATVTLHGGPWTAYGWPAGTPSLAIGGTTLVGSSAASAKLPASKQLVKATVTIQSPGFAGARSGAEGRRGESIDGNSPYTFWIELRDKHRYMVDPDPCCFLVVADLDDAPVRCATKDTCPAGLVEVDTWASHGHDCGNDRRACAAPALLRVRGDKTTIAWDGQDETVTDGAYHAAPVGRENPHRLTVRRNGAIVWDAAIVVHHGQRYTLDATARDVQIVVDAGP